MSEPAEKAQATAGPSFSRVTSIQFRWARCRGHEIRSGDNRRNPSLRPRFQRYEGRSGDQPLHPRVSSAAETPLAGDVLFESVIDEEFGGVNGTLAGRLKGFNADAVILSEPSFLRICPLSEAAGALM